MSKTRIVYLCNNCGHESLKWIGKCPSCGLWNSFEEKKLDSKVGIFDKQNYDSSPVFITDISENLSELMKTGINELDRVLGGGISDTAVTLIAGDPGIGKSTLLLQMAGKLVHKQVSVIYVTGEESPSQIKGRAQRLKLNHRRIPILVETNLENIIYQIENTQSKVVIIDSIQSIYSGDITGAPGNISQVRECSFHLMRLAKEKRFALFLIGHITKEGSIAGPKLLEHMVDVVIYFEGDAFQQYRILRSLKNRYGRTNEIGLFIMEMEGLKEIDNPSRLFLSGKDNIPIGTSVVCSFEGSRPILVEVQALVSRSNYGVPQRTVSGIDQPRLALLLAILEKHCHIHFGMNDVFIKVVGGLKLNDPGIDLGISMAIYSSYINKPLAQNSVYIGEMGLNGDVRPVSQTDRRVDEAVKLGFTKIFLPTSSITKNSNRYSSKAKLNPLDHITELIPSTKKIG